MTPVSCWEARVTSALCWELEALALLAGCLVVASTASKSIDRARAYRRGTVMPDRSDLRRDGLQCAGNVVWVIFGILTGQVMLTAMCAISTVTTTVLIVLNVLARSNANVRGRSTEIGSDKEP